MSLGSSLSSCAAPTGVFYRAAVANPFEPPSTGQAQKSDFVEILFPRHPSLKSVSSAQCG
jgi:hypothetical protein